jgi:integrase
MAPQHLPSRSHASIKAQRKIGATGKGTWGALISAYRASPEFARLADRTRSDYTAVINWLKPIDGMPLLQIDSAAVIRIRDKAFAQRKRRFANHVLQVVGTIMEWGRPRKLALAINPAHGIEKIARPRDLPRANRPWSEAETPAVLGAAKGGLRLALALACYAGMRGGDIVRVTWSIYDGERLHWKQNKTGDEVWLPALPELRTILNDARRVAPTIVTSAYGLPLSEAGLRKGFRMLILRLMREGKVAPGLTLHGCRHTLGDELANLGAEPRMIQAVLGHRSMAASLHYSAGADRRRKASAAIELLAARRPKGNAG